MKKTVMITGADRGVGFAMCRLFAEAGWQVFAGRFGLLEGAGRAEGGVSGNVGTVSWM